MPPKAASGSKTVGKDGIDPANIIGGVNGNPQIKTRGQRHVPIRQPSNYADITWGRNGARVSTQPKAKPKATTQAAKAKGTKTSQKKGGTAKKSTTAGVTKKKAPATKKKSTTTKKKASTKAKDALPSPKDTPRTDKVRKRRIGRVHPKRASTAVEGSQGTSGVSSAPSTSTSTKSKVLKGKPTKVTKKAAVPKKKGPKAKK